MRTAQPECGIKSLGIKKLKEIREIKVGDGKFHKTCEKKGYMETRTRYILDD